MKKIVVQSPTRVDLAGGTIDLWPLFNFLGGATTVNVAIGILTTVELEPLPDTKIILESEDLALKRSYQNLGECLSDTEKNLALLQVQLRFWNPSMGFHLKTRSDSPVGGGLGGSSSMTIGLLKAFSRLTGVRKFKDVHHLVQVAHNLESEVLHTPTGTQDYYPAVSGGLNILHYRYDGIEQKVEGVQGSELEKHFLLVSTGKAHHSGLNNFEVLTRAVKKEERTLQALLEVKQIAEETASVCLQAKYERLPELFRREFAARLRLAPAFSSPEIEKLHHVSLQAGAQAVKICGAGGGGCVLVWVSPACRQRVVEACEKNGFKVLPAKPVAPLLEPL